MKTTTRDRRTKKEILIELEIAQKKLEMAPKYSNKIEGNSFVAMHWDCNALASVDKIAEGLLNMTKLFESQQIKIDTMLNIQGGNNIEIFDKTFKNK